MRRQIGFDVIALLLTIAGTVLNFVEEWRFSADMLAAATAMLWIIRLRDLDNAN